MALGSGDSDWAGLTVKDHERWQICYTAQLLWSVEQCLPPAHFHQILGALGPWALVLFKLAGDSNVWLRVRMRQGAEPGCGDLEVGGCIEIFFFLLHTTKPNPELDK